MNGKILSLAVIGLMTLGCFGAVGASVSTQYTVNDDNDNNILGTGPLSGGRKALCVGIADYPGSGNDLQYTDDDARGMKQVLKQNGWNENDITLFIDSQGTEGAITNKLNNIASQTTASSISLFFFSGHGTQTGDGEAICCYDSNMYDTELNSILDNFNGKVVVIIDACHSGGMGPDGLEFDIDLFITNFINTLGAGNENRVILMACAADEYSYETDELKSGVFSYFVIEGLPGPADTEGNGDGVITAEETFDYAKPKTEKYTENYPHPQHPQRFDGDPNDDGVPIIGGGVSSDIKVTVNIYQVVEQDPIEGWPWDDPDWYYTLRVFSQDVAFIKTEVGPENKKTWTPNKNYVVEVIDYEVEIQIKLMEDDLFLDDLADVSSHQGGGADNFLFDEWLNGERRGAVYHGSYNLITNTLGGEDDYTEEGGYYVITGELDGESGDQNDAKILFKITDNYYKPDLDCDGSLSWTDVKPGETVTGSFKVKNIGESGSKLDWEVKTWPTWGTWTFDPSDGDDLKPEDGTVTVEVTVVAPDDPNTEFTGEVKVVNKEDSSDYEIIPVYLKTPKNMQSSQQYMSPLFFQILEQMLNIR